MPQRIVLPSEELCSYYQSGLSTLALARRYQCSPTTIAKHLRRCGIALRRSRFRSVAVDAAVLRRMYLEERLPIIAIAAYFGVSASTVGNKRRRYGIPLRPRRSTAPALIGTIVTPF